MNEKQERIFREYYPPESNDVEAREMIRRILAASQPGPQPGEEPWCDSCWDLARGMDEPYFLRYKECRAKCKHISTPPPQASTGEREKVMCHECLGSGKLFNAEREVVCDECEGHGELWVQKCAIAAPASTPPASTCVGCGQSTEHHQNCPEYKYHRAIKPPASTVEYPLRVRFIEETGKSVTVQQIEVLIDVVNEDYVLWLEELASRPQSMARPVTDEVVSRIEAEEWVGVFGSLRRGIRYGRYRDYGFKVGRAVRDECFKRTRTGEQARPVLSDEEVEDVVIKHSPDKCSIPGLTIDQIVAWGIVSGLAVRDACFKLNKETP